MNTSKKELRRSISSIMDKYSSDLKEEILNKIEDYFSYLEERLKCDSEKLLDRRIKEFKEKLDNKYKQKLERYKKELFTALETKLKDRFESKAKRDIKKRERDLMIKEIKLEQELLTRNLSNTLLSNVSKANREEIEKMKHSLNSLLEREKEYERAVRKKIKDELGISGDLSSKKKKIVEGGEGEGIRGNLTKDVESKELNGMVRGVEKGTEDEESGGAEKGLKEAIRKGIEEGLDIGEMEREDKVIGEADDKKLDKDAGKTVEQGIIEDGERKVGKDAGKTVEQGIIEGREKKVGKDAGEVGECGSNKETGKGIGEERLKSVDKGIEKTGKGIGEERLKSVDKGIEKRGKGSREKAVAERSKTEAMKKREESERKEAEKREENVETLDLRGEEGEEKEEEIPILSPVEKIQLYIAHPCFRKMVKHCVSLGKDHLEAMGLLLGDRFMFNDHKYTVIKEVVTSDLDSSSVSVKIKDFAPMFEEMHGIERKGKDYILVGWYHSHPGHTCFLSATDVRTQERMFKEDYQVAIVMDSIKMDLKAYKLGGTRGYKEVSYAVF